MRMPNAALQHSLSYNHRRWPCAVGEALCHILPFLAAGGSRHAKEKAFLQEVRRAAAEERANQLRWWGANINGMCIVWCLGPGAVVW